MEDRKLVQGTIAVNDVQDAAFLRFCVIQKVSEDKFVLMYEPNESPHYQMGIAAQEEDVEHIGNVLRTLDHFEVSYETNFDSPAS